MRTLLSLIGVAASLYLVLGLLLYLFQGSMIFLSAMPGRDLETTPQDIGLDYEDVFIETTDDERLHGWFIPAMNSRGTLLFFHGNAGNISHRLDSIAIFNRLGLDVLIIDYRGYGQSSGKTTEAGTYRDAQAAWGYLVGERGVPATQIVIFGRSLGGAIGTWLGSRLGENERPAGVIIESSFSSGVDMARRIYPIFPAGLLTRLRYPVAQYAAQLPSPVLVVHSRDDEIIPFTMGQRIFDAVTQEKQLVELHGDHNAGFWISRETYIPALGAFFDTVLNPKSSFNEGG